jgi:DNA polymerase-1
VKVVLDIETNALFNPTKIWVIVCKDIDTNEYHIFRNLENKNEQLRFVTFHNSVNLWIGHNLLSYDLVHLKRIIGVDIPVEKVLDTLVLSKLIDYPRQGHSIESYGLEFGIEKGKFSDFSQYSQSMEDYCIRDVDICHRIYDKYASYISKPDHIRSIRMEHQFQLVTDQLHNNGFAFNVKKATDLLGKVEEQLAVLDKDIMEAFPPRLKPIRVVTPKATKYGTISLSSIPKSLRGQVHELSVDGSFSYGAWHEFNPSSHKQIIEVLNAAGWKPTDRTKTHTETERDRDRHRYKRSKDTADFKQLQEKLDQLKITGWKVNETNLETLPPSAPVGARLLAKRILLESRRRTLTEWLSLHDDDGRIHGRFQGIGAWTHRMAHQQPNTANIPNEVNGIGKKNLYGKELRSFWCAPKNRLLVGVDAEGIQLRIFAHYIDEPEFTKELVSGDPHSLNQSILGDVCRTREAAKRYIYALLLGAGQSKLQEILECDGSAARQAYERLLKRYPGFALLKETIIPRDAKRGWFVGLDGRRVRLPGDTDGNRRHLAMSGYLQNGEAVVMKLATLRWLPLLPPGCLLVNLVHDEWQTEVPNDMKVALHVASLQADSLRIVGEELGLKCPLSGSYYNKKAKDYTIDKDWSKTH